MDATQIHCPKCDSTQVSIDKKGFSGKKAVAGALLTGGIGLLAGTIGSNNIVATCFACGNTFSPAKKENPTPAIRQQPVKKPAAPLTKTQSRVALILSIIATSFFALLLISMTIAYFMIDSKSGSGSTLYFIAFVLIITLLFGMLSKKYWKLLSKA